MGRCFGSEFAAGDSTSAVYLRTAASSLFDDPAPDKDEERGSKGTGALAQLGQCGKNDKPTVLMSLMYCAGSSGNLLCSFSSSILLLTDILCRFYPQTFAQPAAGFPKGRRQSWFSRVGSFQAWQVMMAVATVGATG